MPTFRISLADGNIAEVRSDSRRQGAKQLFIDGVPQSYVDLTDPTVLLFEYAHYTGRIIDSMRSAPSSVLHLGAGALTLARYIAFRYPNANQVVVELYKELFDFVLDQMPLPPQSHIVGVFGDAREVLACPRGDIAGPFDLILSDIFNGARTPKHLTTTSFIGLAVQRLSSEGVLVLNLPVQEDSKYARRSVASLLSFSQTVAVVARGSVLEGRSKGHVVAFLSKSDASFHLAAALSALIPPSVSVLTDSDLVSWVDAAEVITDRSAEDADNSVLGVAQALLDRRRLRDRF